MARTEQWVDGEGKTFKSKQKWRFRCCDCGLTHDVVLVSGRGVVGMAVKRNNRATAAAHRERRKAEKAAREESDRFQNEFPDPPCLV